MDECCRRVPARHPLLGFTWSFSAYTSHCLPLCPLQLKADIAASFQSVAVTHLAEKSRRGVAWARELAPGLRHLVVAGGVACNKVVRAALEELAGGPELWLKRSLT